MAQTTAERPTVIVINKQELLGEALQRVPAYRALRLAFPCHRIVALSRYDSQFAKGLAAVAPLFLDDCLTYQPIDGQPGRLRRLVRSFGPLDVVIDTRSNLRVVGSALALYFTAPRYVANGVGFFLRKGVRPGVETRGYSHAERYHRLAEIVAGRKLPFDGGLPVQPREDAAAREILPDGCAYFGIATGPLGSVKTWPLEGYVKVAAAIRERGLRPAVLLGRDETDQRPWFEQNVPDAVIVDVQAAHAHNCDLLWLLHAAAGRLFGCVANENGLGHLVAARGVPLLTLAGETNARRWKPLTPVWRVIDAADFHVSRRIGAIPPEAVAKSIVEMVASRNLNAQAPPLRNETVESKTGLSRTAMGSAS
ncbi:MAG TPA: glycosyltransferase family 9 protein [Xanthobacteraceae bacterium]|nr:glycosyltransferase family 9 protein [Xanthobacteraceae bacterium]